MIVGYPEDTLMDTSRRRLLKGAGLLAGGLPFHTALSATSTQPAVSGASFEFENWERLRDEFDLDYSWRNFAGFLFASHPRVVEQDIQRHRHGFNRNPANYLVEGWGYGDETRQKAGDYFGVTAGQIALTDSTTMGLATLYNGISIKPGQEVLTTEHEHYSVQTSLRYRAQREGFKVNTIRFYEEPRDVSTDEVLKRIKQHVNKKTRVLALTWVHSGSSVKLDIPAIGALVAELNAGRGDDDRILFCVDGVHGFGVENLNFDEMACDFFVAGTHKWMFGPRGTGIICSRRTDLAFIDPTIPPFNLAEDPAFGPMMTPGGFHTFEHRWALRKAFEFHLNLGKDNVQSRIHFLNTYLKNRLQEIGGVELVTPMSTEFSSGFTFFRVAKHSAEDVQRVMQARKIIVSPADRDAGPVVRMSPGILNSTEEIDEAVAVLREIA
ncbi:MAG: aminotransferase class V-fold PLP-dependent enzyme [Gammaproteobacteria bacterium]|nr:aminotransferase class V-fold PLP-dependent enzyme [Gammaproteobacteria bacterium]